MTSKYMRILLIILSLGCLTAPAMAVEGEFEVGTIMSNYVWRGIRLSEGPVYQASATVSAKGFSANVWGNYDIDANKYSETDVTLSYSRDIQKFSLETGFVHYAIVDGEDSDEVYAGLSFDGPLQPAFKAYFDVNAGKGAFLQPSIGHSLELSSHASLDLTLSVGVVINNGYMGLKDSGKEFVGLHNAELVVACPVKLSEHWTLKGQIAASTPLSRSAREAIRNGSIWESSDTFNGTMVYGGATLSYSF